jgi:hypothetical protein
MVHTLLAFFGPGEMDWQYGQVAAWVMGSEVFWSGSRYILFFSCHYFLLWQGDCSHVTCEREKIFPLRNKSKNIKSF